MQEPNLMQNQPTVQLENPTKRNFTPKFIALIMGLLIVGSGAYGYVTYLAKKDYNEVVRLSEEGKRQAEEFEQRRMEDSLDTANWQTYRNEEYGFEMRYPKNWQVSKSGSQWFENEATTEEVVFNDPKLRGSDLFPRISISVLAKQLDATLKSPLLPEVKYIQRRSIIISGISGFEISYKSEFSTDQRYVLLPKYNNTFVVLIDRQGVSVDKKQEFDQIISTFKFIK